MVISLNKLGSYISPHKIFLFLPRLNSEWNEKQDKKFLNFTFIKHSVMFYPSDHYECFLISRDLFGIGCPKS